MVEPLKPEGLRTADGWPKYAWPGGYPIFYLAGDHEVICPDCANGKNGSECGRADLDPDDPSDKQWILVAHAINWEDPDMFCSHCNHRIESAYAEPEANS